MDLDRLGFAVLPVAAAAGLGGLAARRAPEVYEQLRKPSWAPPASAFGPVWSTLYVATAAAGWRMPDANYQIAAVRLNRRAVSGRLQAQRCVTISAIFASLCELYQQGVKP